MDWKKVEGTGYMISDEGSVLKPNGKILRFRGTSYRRVPKLGFVHCLVAYHFLEHPISDKYGRWSFVGYEVHHKDRNPSNNRAGNLVYLTKEEHRKLHRVAVNLE